MARKRDRAFAGFFAGLFLLTSSALTIGVIYQVIQSNNTKQSDGAASTPASTTKPAAQPKETKLENFTPTTQPQTQLQEVDTKVGTGATVKAGDTVTVDYTGALMSTGVVFDASSRHGGPTPISLSGVIAGWSQGVPGMKVGGTRRLLIPASLGYGATAQSGIPANSDLVFDITVHKIGQ